MDTPQRLNYKDSGNFVLILPSHISLNKHKKIRSYHLELLSRLVNFPVWSPEEVAFLLYDNFEIYYQKIFDVLDCGAKASEIDTIDLHLFLICTEPKGNRPGLSFLEQMMGYRVEEEPSNEDNPSTTDSNDTEIHSTGDSFLDVKVDSLLVFKNNAHLLWDCHSLEECAKMTIQASHRMRDNSEDNSLWISDCESEDEDDFLSIKDNIFQELNLLNIPTPNILK